MRTAFAASYALLYWRNAKHGKSISDERGGIDVQKRDDLLQTTEKRQGNSVKTHIKGNRELGAAYTWTLESMFDRPDSGFVEDGSWDGSKMTVTAACGNRSGIRSTLDPQIELTARFRLD